MDQIRFEWVGTGWNRSDLVAMGRSRSEWVGKQGRTLARVGQKMNWNGAEQIGTGAEQIGMGRNRTGMN